MRTCLASSRVGASTRHCGRRCLRAPGSWDARIFSITGMAKARVLPEPVLARAMRSEPLMAGSNTVFWMGKRAVMPRSSRALTCVCVCGGGGRCWMQGGTGAGGCRLVSSSAAEAASQRGETGQAAGAACRTSLGRALHAARVQRQVRVPGCPCCLGVQAGCAPALAHT